MKSKLVLAVAGLILVCFSHSFAQVPQMINYQGKLTKAGGALLDTTIQMVFSIYADSNGSVLKWTETQGAVKVEKGIFNVLLGSSNPIPDTVFDGSVRYLGVQVGADPEITPRKPMVSVPYAYRSASAGSGSLNCHDCDSVFVNTHGPDTVVSTFGTALRVNSSDSSGSAVTGLRSEAFNYGNGHAYAFVGEAGSSVVGEAYGGRFHGFAFGTDPSYGVYGVGEGNGSASYGSYGWANNGSTGSAYGGYFNATNNGTGTHYGVWAKGNGSSSSYVYGVVGSADNTSTAAAYGGLFSASSNGTGTHYGVYGSANGSSSNSIFGSTGYGSNSSTGDVYAGYFDAINEGTGTHYGIYTLGRSSSSSAAYGCYGRGFNTSTGPVYGGYFVADNYGTGTKYGIYASAPAAGYAGYFSGNTLATGTKSAAVKVDNGEYRQVYSLESPEIWFEDFGEGQLVNGRARIELDPMFLQTVTIDVQQPLKVFITLTSGDPMNYMVNKGNTSFELIVSDNSSNATFDYRVVAKRRGYENLRLARMEGATPEQVALEQSKNDAKLDKERAKANEERLKREEEMRQTDEQQARMSQELNKAQR